MDALNRNAVSINPGRSGGSGGGLSISFCTLSVTLGEHAKEPRRLVFGLARTRDHLQHNIHELRRLVSASLTLCVARISLSPFLVLFSQHAVGEQAKCSLLRMEAPFKQEALGGSYPRKIRDAASWMRRGRFDAS